MSGARRLTSRWSRRLRAAHSGAAQRHVSLRLLGRAVRSLVTNAVPTLLKKLTADPSSGIGSAASAPDAELPALKPAAARHLNGPRVHVGHPGAGSGRSRPELRATFRAASGAAHPDKSSQPCEHNPGRAKVGKRGIAKSTGQPDMLKPNIGGAQANQPLERTPPRFALRRRSTAR